MEEGFSGFEQQLNSAMAGETFEKSRYDKLLGKEDAMKLRDMIKKEMLTEIEVDEIMNICVSLEVKLSRLDDNERKLLGLFYCRADEYSKRFKQAIKVYEFYMSKEGELSKKIINLRKEIIREYISQFKLNTHSYLYAIRSALSVEGNMIDSLTTDSKDIQYNYPPGLAPPQSQQNWGRGN